MLHVSRPMELNRPEVAKRIGVEIETLMRVYAHWIPTQNRDTAARVDAIYKPKKPKPKSFRARLKAEKL